MTDKALTPAQAEAMAWLDKTGARIVYDGGEQFYFTPFSDDIHLPPIGEGLPEMIYQEYPMPDDPVQRMNFWISRAFHELTHWSGKHCPDSGRPWMQVEEEPKSLEHLFAVLTRNQTEPFEEMIAETGAYILANVFGLAYPRVLSDAYVNHMAGAYRHQEEAYLKACKLALHAVKWMADKAPLPPAAAARLADIEDVGIARHDGDTGGLTTD